MLSPRRGKGRSTKRTEGVVAAAGRSAAAEEVGPERIANPTKTPAPPLAHRRVATAPCTVFSGRRRKDRVPVGPLQADRGIIALRGAQRWN